MARTEVAASHFSGDTVEFIRLLANYRVRYVIVGGEAVIFYGYARLTGDVDFFYDLRPENLKSLHELLLDFWSGSIPGDLSIDDLSVPGQIIQFGQPPNRIDLLNRISGVEFDEAWRSRTEVDIRLGDQDITLQFIGLDQLIKNKSASGRPKDADDLAYLEALRRP